MSKIESVEMKRIRKDRYQMPSGTNLFIKSELYYWSEITQKFMPHPWHYNFFSTFAWYRELTGWTWKRFEVEPNYFCWHRVKDLS